MRSLKYLIFISVLLLTGVLSVGAQDLSADEIIIEQLPDKPFLPDPLLVADGVSGEEITTRAMWKQKREWIKSQYEYWVSGSLPPAPDRVYSRILFERTENDVVIRMVEISWGPDQEAKITVELMIPPVKGKLPVFMTQWNHRGWAQVAVRRGYIGCVYAGADAKDDTDNYDEIYENNDFATLMKRAWGSHRVVDYLYTLPEVDQDKIALTGHSRNGKQSLMAAAFDDRIGAVVSSSGGTGGESLFRFTDRRFDTESVEEITRNFPHWFHPRFRLFSGREQKLPVDQNSLMALIAPRGLMLSSAITEGQGNPWAIGKAYQSVKTVYDFLGADDQIAINLRGGRHATAARDIEDFIDFFDFIFGRTTMKPENKLFYDYTFAGWMEKSGESPADVPLFDLDKRGKEDIQDRIQWLLGKEPAGIFNNSEKTWANRKSEDDYLGDVIGQPNWDGMKNMLIRPYNSMGDYLWANLYLPANVQIAGDSITGNYPLIVFLHEYSYPTGYRRRVAPILRELTDRGFAVLAFDMIGFGTRIEESMNFYKRYPHWSLMGKMVADARNIIHDASSGLSFIDQENIFLAGYALGGTVALFTAALDDRIKGVAVAGAVTSFRNPDPATEGNRHFSHLHGLLPRLGLFEGNESDIPVDFDDILSCVQPIPTLVIAPMQDRHHPRGQVERIVNAAVNSSGAGPDDNTILFVQPDTYDQFSPDMIRTMADWLKEQSE